ncbi:MAG TPA: UvrD-helicase domain-containing protein [Vicinamibacteria bacterium]|nr:UvrD-helicase domain-containing protein [Vicinamibacteria bacterium]
MLPSVLEGLNDQQRAAVTAPEGPTLVLAGAGSGKTRVIVHRIAHLIRDRGVMSDAVLAVTFTNKAAGEMRRRVQEMLGEAAEPVWLHTFHALCLRLLRRFGEDVGLAPGFTVCGEDDRRALLRGILRESNVSDREYPIGRVAAAVSAFKHRGLGGSQRDDGVDPVIARVAGRYQKRMEEQGSVDFDDLLLQGVELLECSTRAQAFCSNHFRHVLVDEYQDTNRTQYRLLRLLAPHQNVFVVGDEDQSIYKFRGADLRNILDFERDFPEARVVSLETNYRSAGAILRAADAVIRHNRERKGKRLIAWLDEGQKPVLHAAEEERDEAHFVAQMLEGTRLENPAARSAILLRTHAQSRPFEEELVARGIPHQILGGLRFYERREIKDAIAYARLLSNLDDDASFSRVVNVPPRGIGTQTISLLRARAETTRSSLFESASALIDDGILSGRARSGLRTFLELVTRLKQGLESNRPSRTLRRIVTESGLLALVEGEGQKSAVERKDNLEQLVAAAAEYEASETVPSLEGFLDRVSLLTDADTESAPARCLVMTLHAAKGLEFDTVFLVGLEEGLFPHVHAMSDGRKIEEERRLFYVGMTRAKRRLVLSYARRRRFSHAETDRVPSRFVTEIDAALLSPTSSEARPPRTKASPHKARLRAGALVRHAVFGDGRVVDSSGSGRDCRVTVVFHKAGRKRLVAEYAKLDVVG